MSATDRLIADLIAPVHYRDRTGDTVDAYRARYAAARLALAEQQAEPRQAPPGCPHCHNEGDCSSVAVCRAVAEVYVEPPRADWIQGAKQKAHSAAQKQVYLHADAVYHSLVTEAALDSFIAAMPKSQPEHEVERLRMALVDAYTVFDMGGHTAWHTAHGETLKRAQEWVSPKASFVTPSPEPQPQEVPPNILEDAIARNCFRSDSGVRDTDWHMVVQDIWNEAKRYAPMPQEVTEEMVESAARIYLRDFSHPTVVVRRMLEAALSSKTKE